MVQPQPQLRCQLYCWREGPSWRAKGSWLERQSPLSCANGMGDTENLGRHIFGTSRQRLSRYAAELAYEEAMNLKCVPASLGSGNVLKVIGEGG
jgi:hypothetical protein